MRVVTKIASPLVFAYFTTLGRGPNFEGLSMGMVDPRATEMMIPNLISLDADVFPTNRKKLLPLQEIIWNRSVTSFKFKTPLIKF
jgi:hypothetical protein